MSKICIVSVAIGLTFVLANPAQADDGPPGLKKKGGVPPGLAKKGGVPPGQAKKQADEQPQQNSAPPQVTTAPAPSAPTSSTPATPAAPAVASAPKPSTPSTPAAVPAPPPPSGTSKPTVSNYELKNRIDREVETIKDRMDENHLATPALKEISRLTGVPVGRLEEQRTAHGAGYPALLLGNLIAKQSNASFSQLMAARKTEKDWSTIAVRYHVPLAPLLDDLLALKRRLNEAHQRRS